MGGRRRALAGTRTGNTPCARCRHAKLGHLDHGTGGCSRYSIESTTDDWGRPVPQAVRCTCDRFTTELELY